MATKTRDFAEIASLAATRAALDPQRNSWRNDILVSGVIEVLARRGPSSARKIQAEVSRIWVTSAIDRGLVRDALDHAFNAQLVTRETRAGGEERWTATPSAIEDAKSDREWAQRLLASFEADVATRLTQDLSSLDSARVPRLTRQLLEEMVRAATDAVTSVGGQAPLADVQLNLAGAASRIRAKVQPRPVADALASLLLAAADPSDEFGQDILGLITTGQVLHRMVANRDLDPSVASPQEMVAVIDTSALLALLEPEPGPAELFTDFLARANACGCETVVTWGVLEEWERQWEVADEARPRLEAAAGAISFRLSDSPVLRG